MLLCLEARFLIDCKNMNKSLINNNKAKNHLRGTSHQAGFTLIELAIVMVISGFLISLLGSALVSYTKKNKIKTTEFRMEKIEEALEQYLNINGRYPCAASRFLGPDDTNFAEQQTTNCRGGPVLAGTVRVPGQLGSSPLNSVRIGAVPTRTLNLPDEFIVDAWGNKFTYAVTETQATIVPLDPNQSYAADGGRIAVRDGVSNTVVFPANSAHYVIISHGITGNGAYPLGAATTPSVVCGAAADSLNCNDASSIFRTTLVNSDVGNASFFDDYVRFKGQTAPVITVPVGAVVAFNLSSCPTSEGWVDYTPAQGRFVIGSSPAGSMAISKYNMPPAGSTATLPISIGSVNGGDHEAAIPPYVALIYCVKQ